MITNSPLKFQEVFQVVSEKYDSDPDWVTFFREVLGTDGIIRQTFHEPQALAAFEKSTEYDAIQHMLVKLREKNSAQNEDREPTRVITVRMPRSLHESLRSEAHEHHTSMNKLCISKLLQVIGEEMIPTEA